MEPATATIFLAAATGFQAIGSIAAGNAKAAALKTQANLNERNAVIARQQAAADADRQQRDSYRKLGAARAAYGASGVTMEGSPLDVLSNSAAEAEMDRQTILYRGELRAMGFTDQAEIDRSEASSARTAGYLGAAGSTFSGASKYLTRSSGAGSSLSDGSLNPYTW